jgi:hypothetical protein
MTRYAHFILNAIRLQSIDSVGMHLVLNLDVQVAIISGVWRARKSSGDLFPCRDRYGFLGIEDGLSRKRRIESRRVIDVVEGGLTSNVYIVHVDQC